MEGFIYKVTNIITNESYIGQTTRDLEKRWTNHKYAAFTSNASDYHRPLYYSMREYGIENFIMEVVEKIERGNDKDLLSVLNILEKKYIKEFDTRRNGFNIERGGGNTKRNFGNVYLKFDTKGELVDVYRTIAQTGYSDSKFYTNPHPNSKFYWEKHIETDLYETIDLNCDFYDSLYT